MGRWQREALTEGPATVAQWPLHHSPAANGPLPHAFSAGRILTDRPIHPNLYARHGGGASDVKATANAMRNSRRLRRAMTPPEVALWQHLRGSPAGIRFRRQYAVGSFVADFYCPVAKLVIEVDGAIHDGDEAQVKDMARDAWLRSEGFEVIRVTGSDVLRDSAAVADAILQLCSNVLAPPPLSFAERSPSPRALLAGRIILANASHYRIKRSP